MSVPPRLLRYIGRREVFFNKQRYILALAGMTAGAQETFTLKGKVYE